MCPNPHETTDLATFTGEILNGKLQFLCSEEFKAFNSSSLKLFWGLFFLTVSNEENAVSNNFDFMVSFWRVFKLVVSMSR